MRVLYIYTDYTIKVSITSLWQEFILMSISSSISNSWYFRLLFIEYILAQSTMNINNCSPIFSVYAQKQAQYPPNYGYGYPAAYPYAQPQYGHYNY